MITKLTDIIGKMINISRLQQQNIQNSFRLALPLKTAYFFSTCKYQWIEYLRPNNWKQHKIKTAPSKINLVKFTNSLQLLNGKSLPKTSSCFQLFIGKGMPKINFKTHGSCGRASHLGIPLVISDIISPRLFWMNSLRSSNAQTNL